MRHGHDARHARRAVAALLAAGLALVAPARAEADVDVRPVPPGRPAPSGETWLGRVHAALLLPGLVARRDAAVAAEADARAPAAGPPEPGPWKRAQAAGRACLEAAPPLGLTDDTWTSPRLGVSIREVLGACEVLLAAAASGLERVEAERVRRASLILPLLKGDRKRVFEERGEPRCDCGGEPLAPEKVARAKEWVYVTGPSGPLDTYETRTFVFRGDKLVEERQRVAHERP